MIMPRRKAPPHMPPLSFGNRSEIFFLTVCTRRKKALLARQDVHTLLIESWRKANSWLVGRYVLLPDHLHLFCAQQSEIVSIQHWCAYWKRLCSKNWPRPGEYPIWQKNLWDTQVRSADWYEARWQYVLQNPVRHGLVTEPDLWPYKGELNVLEWHDP